MDGSLVREVTQVEESCILSLRADNELVFLVGHPSDSSDCFRVPILIFIIIVVKKLATESKTALTLFLLLVLLLILLHLELHHLHFPDTGVKIGQLDFETLIVIDSVFVWLADLVDKARFTSDNDLR